MQSYNPFSLSGKTILVTGASSGIGRSTAIECSRIGAKLVLTGRNLDRLNETMSMLTPNEHTIIPADFEVEEDLNKLVEEICRIDGIIHAPGVVKTLPFHYINKTELTRVFDVNFMAPVILSQKLLKAKKINKGGSIVFLSSIEGNIVSHVGNSIYAASKGAISAMVRSMALELAPKKIRVNGILPGMTDTPMIYTDAITAEQMETELNKYPLRRYGKPEEIAYAAIYLLSDASGWVTGTQLVIDGGYTLL